MRVYLSTNLWNFYTNKTVYSSTVYHLVTISKETLYTLISSNTTLRYMFAQGILESHLELTSNMCLYSNFTYVPFLSLS
jgi:hypothetical protein